MLKSWCLAPHVMGTPLKSFPSDGRPSRNQFEELLLCLGGEGIFIKINAASFLCITAAVFGCSVDLAEK